MSEPLHRDLIVSLTWHRDPGIILSFTVGIGLILLGAILRRRSSRRTLSSLSLGLGILAVLFALARISFGW